MGCSLRAARATVRLGMQAVEGGDEKAAMGCRMLTFQIDIVPCSSEGFSATTPVH